jgi:type III pantothenate kinase
MGNDSAAINHWLTLMIGNSRLHWGYFCEETLTLTWNTPHVKDMQQLPALFPPQIQSLYDSIPLYIASVVPSLTEKYLNLELSQVIRLEDVPLTGIYSTMGIDRALALSGAGYVYGFPCLVIDGGTALTFNVANQEGEFSGGAILPGVRLQLNSLAEKTGALPYISLSEKIPPLLAKTTPNAISSGIIYTLSAGIQYFIDQVLAEFPDCQIIFTGGDGLKLKTYLEILAPELRAKLNFELNLIFYGFKSVIKLLRQV